MSTLYILYIYFIYIYILYIYFIYTTLYILYIYFIYTLYILYIYTLYILYIYSIYTLYILYIYFIYTLYILYIYSIYTLHILYIYFIYTLYILYIYSTYTLYILYIYSIYTLYILYIYFIYTLYILYIYFIYTLYILYIYFIYTLYILYIHLYINISFSESFWGWLEANLDLGTQGPTLFLLAPGCWMAGVVASADLWLDGEKTMVDMVEDAKWQQLSAASIPFHAQTHGLLVALSNADLVLASLSWRFSHRSFAEASPKHQHWCRGGPGVFQHRCVRKLGTSTPNGPSVSDSFWALSLIVRMNLEG